LAGIQNLDPPAVETRRSYGTAVYQDLARISGQLSETEAMKSATYQPRGTPDGRVRMIIALAINAALVAGLLVAGALARSLGLWSQAGESCTDIAAITGVLVATRWASRPPTPMHTYGFHRATILIALGNTLLVAGWTVFVAWQSVTRLLHERPVNGEVELLVGVAALVANGAALYLLREHGHSLAERAILIDLVGDVATAALVSVAGLVILATGGNVWIDPAAALVVSIAVGYQAWRLLHESMDILLEGTPSGIDMRALGNAMEGVPGIGEVHDLHVWSLSSDLRALSAHLVLTGHPSLEEAQAVGTEVRRAIREPFGIGHATLELECERCVDTPDDPCDLPGSVDTTPDED